MKNESSVSTQQALIRFMLYTDINRRRATQVGHDHWVDIEEIFANKYTYGTQHELAFPEFDNQPGLYIVAMMPYLQQIAHPHQNNRLVSLQTVYLTTAALWPFFEPITPDSLKVFFEN